MRKLDFNPTFKKELSNLELKGIEAVIDSIGESRGIEEFAGMTTRDFGLAYTSSSGYAMYNVCEAGISLAYDDNDHPIELSYFAVTENDMLIAVGYDVFEHTHYYEIEATEFY